MLLIYWENRTFLMSHRWDIAYLGHYAVIVSDIFTLPNYSHTTLYQ